VISVGENVEVVVIDDDASVRRLLKEMLSVAKISHLAAGSGPEGLRLISQYKPRLAIVDVKLGGMNGFDVAHRIRDIDGGTSIIFITGYEDAVKGKVGEDLPVAGIVEKPFDVPRFLALIRNVLNRSARLA
jgi:DNA-binding response OmpR family regulator